MTKYIIGIVVGVVLTVVVTITVITHQRAAASPPDLDQQVNDVARNLHPTKLNP
jgi:cell division protein FtsN